jgi:hypothetical protein
MRQKETEMNDNNMFIYVMEDAFKKTWSNDQEDILRRISYNCGLMSDHHRTEYYTLTAQLKWFRIPVIILSSLNAVFSVGLSSYLEQNVVSTLTCLLSLIVSCIGSVELYLALQKKSDNELISYRAFYTLALRINTTLDLDVENRNQEGDPFLAEIIAEYRALFESSNPNGIPSDKIVPLKEIEMTQNLIIRGD